MTIMVPLTAIAFSVAFLFFLHRGDPKRRRTAHLPGKGQSRTQRRLLVAMALVPGIVCAIRGEAAPLLIWLGGCAILGWTLTIALSARGRPSS